MDPSQMGGHPGARHMSHAGPSHYGGHIPSPHSVVAPLYPSMAGPSQSPTSGIKRSRPDDLDLSMPGMAEMEQGDLDPMQQSSLGAAYAQTAVSQSGLPPPPTHHHHRLPDTAPPVKMMRREGDGGGGGAPSVVGHPGMPPPAPRPRGPKLKFTPEDDQLLIDLKENKSLTWKQIADFFPGRSSGTLQVRYCTKLKAKTTQWTDETVSKPSISCRASPSPNRQDCCRRRGKQTAQDSSSTDACLSRIKSFVLLCKTTKTKSGALSQTKSALASLQLLVVSGRQNSSAMGSQAYSNQRPQQDPILSLGTPALPPTMATEQS
jgi:hypothetical protein